MIPPAVVGPTRVVPIAPLGIDGIQTWDKNAPTKYRITEVAKWLRAFGGLSDVERFLDPGRAAMALDMPLFVVHEGSAMYGEDDGEILF